MIHICILQSNNYKISIVPPTINLDNPDVTTPIDLVPNKAQKRDVTIAMSNSFGFGGTNAALIVSKI